MHWDTEEYRSRYWEEKKKEHEKALAFMADIKMGDKVKIERYACPCVSPYCLEDLADVTIKEVVEIYAVNHKGLFFTTTKGTAIGAATVINWKKIIPEPELFD